MVLGLRVHEVGTAADVLATALGYKLQGQRVSAGGDAVGARVVGSLKDAVGCALGVVGAERRVPGVASVAVCVAVLVVDPAPVRVYQTASQYVMALLMQCCREDLPMTISPWLVVQLEGELQVCHVILG